MERRGQAIRVIINLVNWQQEEPTGYGGGRQLSMDGTSHVTGDSHARLCVQQRLACSVGDKPTEAKVRSLVAWIAGRKETKFLKPIDGIIRGMVASHWAVTKVNAEVASKVSGPRGRACNRRAKAAWMVAPD